MSEEKKIAVENVLKQIGDIEIEISVLKNRSSKNFCGGRIDSTEKEEIESLLQKKYGEKILLENKLRTIQKHGK